MFKYINNKFQEVYDLDTLFSQIKDHITSIEEKNKQLEQENKRIKSEKYAESELASIKERLKEMEENYYRGFPISAEQDEAIAEWEKKHKKEKHNKTPSSSAIGGSFQFRFIPTSIGTIATCICLSCMRKAEEKFYSYPKRSRTTDLKSKLIKIYDAEFCFQELE